MADDAIQLTPEERLVAVRAVIGSLPLHERVAVAQAYTAIADTVRRHRDAGRAALALWAARIAVAEEHVDSLGDDNAASR